MNTFQERLRTAMKAKGMTQAELARVTGITTASICHYVNGIYIAKQKHLYLIAKALDCSTDYLMGLEEEPNGEPSKTDENQTIPNALPVTVKTIPLFKEISCGQPVFAEQDIKSYVPVGSDIEADFCVIANGDSMTGARINDGDIVFIRQTERVNDGEIAAVWIDGEGATLKRVYIQDGILSLVAENPKYKPLFYAEERAHEIRLLGKAVAFQSNVI